MCSPSRIATLAAVVTTLCVGFGFAGCVFPGDRASYVSKLRPSEGPWEGSTGGELANLVDRTPPGTTAPAFAFVFGQEYVNTSAVKLAWVNPTDKPWFLAPGAEAFFVDKRPASSKDSGGEAGAGKMVIGTRVRVGNDTQVRRGSEGAGGMWDKHMPRAPRGYELDVRSDMWPDILDRLTAEATEVAASNNLVLPPHSEGYIVSLFLAYGYRNAEFALELSDGIDKTRFTLALDRIHTSYPRPIYEFMFDDPKEGK